MARFVEFSFGGQLRQFRLTHAALEKLEREAGLASFTDLVSGEIKLSARLTASLLWCALLWKEPTVTREQVVIWIDEADSYAQVMMQAIEVVGAALETFAELDPANPSTPPSGGTGGPPDVLRSLSG